MNKTIRNIKDEELKASELRYRRLFETTQAGILLLDFDSGIILDVNPFLINLLGYSKADFLKKYLWEIGVFENIAASKERFAVLQKKKNVRFEDLPLKTRTGKKIYVDFIAIAYQADGKTTIQCNIRDITKYKQTEKDLNDARIASRNVLEDLQTEKEMLARARALDQAMITSIGDGIIATGQDGNIIRINQSAGEILGYDSNDLLGKQLHKMIAMYDETGNVLPLEKRPIHIVLTTGKAVTTKTIDDTYYYVRRNGTKFPASITVAPIILDKNIMGAVEVFRDVTHEQEVDRAKTEFVSVASHELRTPLTAIDGLVSMILDGEYGKVNKNLKQPLEDVGTSSERLIKLVNDLLSVSRIQAGRLRYNLSEFSISAAISGIVKLLLPLAQEKKLNLQIDHLDKVNVQADRDKIEEIFDNLIGNSLKFTYKGSITVSTKVVNDKVEIAITDTGAGISKADQQKLFGLFQQLESPKEGTAGTGLGLHISRELARRMGGDLWLEKSKLGTGSTFIFSIPLAKSAASQKAKTGIKEEEKLHPDLKSNKL